MNRVSVSILGLAMGAACALSASPALPMFNCAPSRRSCKKRGRGGGRGPRVPEPTRTTFKSGRMLKVTDRVYRRWTDGSLRREELTT